MPLLRRLLALAVLLGFVALVAVVLQPETSQPEPADAAAAALPAITGPVILTVSGLDEKRFAGGVVEFDIGRLEALGRSEIETTTIWTEGKHRYTGVLLADLLTSLGLSGTVTQLEFRALNDYAIEFAANEATAEAPLLAYLEDGQPMPVRDKGPLWLIYPYDCDADYRTDTIYARSIWLLDRITVLR